MNSISSCQFDEAVVEDDVLPDAEIACHPFEAEPIGFALLADEIRMRGAEDDVDDVGKLANDLRQRLERVLDPFVRREQAERESDVLPLDAELFLEAVRIDERHVGNAMRDDVDLRGGHAINIAVETRDLAATSRRRARRVRQVPVVRGVDRAFGSLSTVCSVVTTGMRISRSSARMWPPRLAAVDAVLVLQRRRRRCC